MASSPWIEHVRSEPQNLRVLALPLRMAAGMRRMVGFGLLLVATLACGATIPPAPAQCTKRVYLTFDTGHMGVADHIAQVLQQTGVRVTFFAANEPTQLGDGSLGEHWSAWWKARAAEGHQMASHTYDHVYWRGDLPNGAFQVRPSSGPKKDQTFVLSADQYCGEISRSAKRLEDITGQAALPLFRAPGGKTSVALESAARTCGYAHVGWSPAGFLGDELSSERYPNAQLLRQALQRIRPNDILVAHLGIWSRKDPWAPAVLKPLIEGLQAKGFCFDTMDQHPDFRQWVRTHTR